MRKLLFIAFISVLVSGCASFGKSQLSIARTQEVAPGMAAAVQQLPIFYDNLIDAQYSFAATLIASDPNCPLETPLILPLPEQAAKQTTLCPPPYQLGLLRQLNDEQLFNKGYRRVRLIVASRDDFAPYLQTVQMVANYLDLLARLSAAPAKQKDFQIAELRQVADSANAIKKMIDGVQAGVSPQIKVDASAFRALFDYVMRLQKAGNDAAQIRALLQAQGPEVEQQLQKLVKSIRRWDVAYFSPILANSQLVQQRNFQQFRNDMSYQERRAFVKALLLGQRDEGAVSSDIGKQTAELLSQQIEAHKALRALIVDGQMSDSDRKKQTELQLKTIGEGLVVVSQALSQSVGLAIKAMSLF